MIESVMGCRCCLVEVGYCVWVNVEISTTMSHHLVSIYQSVTYTRGNRRVTGSTIRRMSAYACNGDNCIN
jgi:hypothetical protein